MCKYIEKWQNATADNHCSWVHLHLLVSIELLQYREVFSEVRGSFVTGDGKINYCSCGETQLGTQFACG